jgi:hypothetical protein
MSLCQYLYVSIVLECLGLTVRGTQARVSLRSMWDFDSPIELAFDGGCGNPGHAGIQMSVPRLKPGYRGRGGPAHPHRCDWGRGVCLLAKAVDDQEEQQRRDGGGAGGLGVRQFSGAIACHHVDVIGCAERSAAEQGSLQHPHTAASLSLEECQQCYTAPSRHVMHYRPLLGGCSPSSWRGGGGGCCSSSSSSSTSAADSNVSRIIFGCARLSSLKDPSAVLDAAWSLGCTTFDVAHVYGRNEGILGQWLESRGGGERGGSTACLPGGPINRGDVIIIGKGGHPARGDERAARLDPSDLSQDLHESLQRLRTTYITVYRRSLSFPRFFF